MKILNLSESTVYLDDISLPVLYNRENNPLEVDDRLAKTSRNLRWAIREGLLLDVTDGIPDVLPSQKRQEDYAAPKKTEQTEQTEESPFRKIKSLLVDNEPRLTGMDPVTEQGTKKPKAPPKPNAVEQYEKDGTMSIMWTGPATDHGGYSHMNKQFMFGLSDKGVKVKYDHLLSINDVDPKTQAKINKLQSVSVPNDAPKVYGMTAPLHYAWDRYKLLFTMMETRRLHKDYVERCNCADEIVVPTNWCKSTFVESGVKVPIDVVPLGVDTSIYKPDAEPLGFTANLSDYVFLSVFGWSLRKGYDVLLKAYLEEFTSDEPVSLLISSRYFGSTDESKKKVIRDDIARVSSMVSNPKKPHLILFGDSMSIDMMPRLYASADCYVLFSRGEGFALPFCEAAACRLPCIGTRYSGQTDFLDDDNSYLVDIDGFRRAGKELSWISYFYEDQEFPILGPSVVEQARVMMRRVYENREEAKEKAGKLYDKVVTEYNWNRCTDLMREKLQRTFERLGDWKCRRDRSS